MSLCGWLSLIFPCCMRRGLKSRYAKVWLNFSRSSPKARRAHRQGNIQVDAVAVVTGPAEIQRERVLIRAGMEQGR